ncbi:hypothetical protein N7577_23220, partial [Enterobacter roggenkampii]|nr:hypothetical protein [Enterobacter roggenkampii]
TERQEQESARGSHQGETPGIFIVLSGFATTDLSVRFMMLVRGAKPMEKRLRRNLILSSLLSRVVIP